MIGGDDEAERIRQRISSLVADEFPAGRMLHGDAVKDWSATTHPLLWRPKIVLRPRNSLEVESIVKVLEPLGRIGVVSRGRNIGLGERVGQLRCDFVIDLGDLRSILDYDGLLGSITIEAGVSFQDVHDYLEKRDSRFFLPAIGGPPDASVIGNALQRGDGIGPPPGRESAILGLEAVLHNGRTIALGRLKKPKARVGLTDRVGADRIGLFLQSDLGIVTCATFPLVGLPKALLGYSIALEVPRQLCVAIDRLRFCFEQGILQPCCGSLWSEGKVAARLGLEPPRRTSRWFISGALYGASVARVESDWSDLVGSFSRAGVDFAVRSRELLTAPFPRNIYTGRPSDANLVQLRYGASPADSARARGFAWLCPVLPFCGETVAAALEIIFRALDEAKIPENIALHPHSPLELRAFVALSWNRDDAGANQRAQACHDRLLVELAQLGCPPFRLGHLAGNVVPEAKGLAGYNRAVTEALSAIS